MKQNELKAFIAEVSEKEVQVNNLLEAKCKEFVKERDALTEELVELMNELFPADIETLFQEYQRYVGGFYADGELWIGFETNELVAKLNPQHYDHITAVKYNFMLCGLPTDINGLALASKKLEAYEFLKQELVSKIEKFYETIAKWKEEKLNKELTTLNSIQFGTKENASNEQYKILIVIEKVTEKDEILEKITQLFKNEKVYWCINKYAEIIKGKECIECSCDFIKERKTYIYVPNILFADIEKSGTGKIEKYLAEKITERIKAGILHLI